MLPFLNPKRVSSVMIAKSKPDGSVEAMNEEGEHSPGMMSAAEDMLSAIHMKDAKALATAHKAMMDLHENEGDDDSNVEHIEGE